ncbi:hydantoinase/oxoprolinase family protein [Azospirillum sp. SYSU D00513]|uniref:hydantoinase/oxoprolinase family protein n=1 Tax=Azospirillum sp. SYSU D00513 TaxID=2812561 RepID=UPI001A973AFD|nr:hydantoinase/oxoprolinase family protein [Azospirillum sp. SYSU D00513]
MVESVGRATIGWDLGGAHLKAARVGASGRLEAVVQVPCRLWQGLGEFDAAVAAVFERMPPADNHAVTMTGELVDLFESRCQGVEALIDRMASALNGARLRVFAGRLGLLDPADARGAVLDVASANWLASAALVARRLEEALFVDMGSTTTDLVPVRAGRVEARGRTDHERMAVEELVYTGLTRTPVMAMARSMLVAGERVPLMAEYFATSADVHRVLGTLDESADQHPAADNGPKTPQASARRLGRMVGRDLEELDMERWRDVARDLAEGQLRTIHDAALRVLSACPLPQGAPLVGAGAGRAVVKALADRLGRPYRDFAEIAGAEGEDLAAWTSHCAPAAAVALLGAEG